MNTPQRTPEGWLVVMHEYRNDDPWVFDDNWHRGAYHRYWIPGTYINVETGISHRETSEWNRLEDAIRDAGLHGTFELVETDPTKGPGYRVMHTVTSKEEHGAQVAEAKKQFAEFAAMSPEEQWRYCQE